MQMNTNVRSRLPRLENQRENDKNRIARKAINLCCMVHIFFFQLLASAYAGGPLAGILRT